MFVRVRLLVATLSSLHGQARYRPSKFFFLQKRAISSMHKPKNDVFPLISLRYCRELKSVLHDEHKMTATSNSPKAIVTSMPPAGSSTAAISTPDGRSGCPPATGPTNARPVLCFQHCLREVHLLCLQLPNTCPLCDKIVDRNCLLVSRTSGFGQETLGFEFKPPDIPEFRRQNR